MPAPADFVRALALAWKNLAAYPPGHPSRDATVAEVHRRLSELRGPAGEVAFGIASDALVYSDEKLMWPQAQKLAQSLYVRGVAVLRFSAATSVAELQTFLQLLVTPPREQAAPIWEALTAAGVANINLQPVDYSSVQQTNDLSDPAPAVSPASLWEQILTALLAGKDIAADARQLLTSVRSVDEFASLIMRHINDAGGAAPFDPDATFGVRLLARVQSDSPEAATSRVAEAIGMHVAKSSGLKRQLAIQQIVQVLRSLPDPIRTAIMRSVLEVLATDEAAASSLRDFTSSLGRDEVLEALRYLATIVTLSSHATRLLQALSAIPSRGTEPPPAPPSLVSDLMSLFGDEDIDRYNPPDHSALLNDIAIEIPKSPSVAPRPVSDLGDRVESVTDAAVRIELARTLLDLVERGAGTPRGPLRRVEAVVQSLIADGEFADALSFVSRLQELERTATDSAARAALSETLGGLASAGTMNALVSGLLAAPAEKTATIQRLIDALGAAALQSLLIALAEESNRSRRRKLFDFLASLGPKIVPDVTRYLDDERWYVVRNMIIILRGVNDRTSLPAIRRLAEHGDLRVRLEAIKSLLILDPTVPPSLLENAINDRDPKMAETAIALAANYGIREAVGPLLRILTHRDLFGAQRPIRIRALKALGELADPATLPHLRRFFSDSRWPWPHRDERVAAWESLAGYPAAARAPLIEAGLRSRDATVRIVCQRMNRGER